MASISFCPEPSVAPFEFVPGKCRRLQRNPFLSSPQTVISDAGPSRFRRRRVRHTRRARLGILRPGPLAGRFVRRVTDLFTGSEPPCKVRFFMTCISLTETFGEREVVALESLFRSQPSGCLVIVSTFLNFNSNNQTLYPFVEKGLKIAAVLSDFDYLFRDTAAQSWFDRLRNGRGDPKEVPLGQNVLNLLRLSLLYKPQGG